MNGKVALRLFRYKSWKSCKIFGYSTLTLWQIFQPNKHQRTNDVWAGFQYVIFMSHFRVWSLTEAVVQGCSVKKVFLEILRNFYELFFLQNISGGCFCIKEITLAETIFLEVVWNKIWLTFVLSIFRASLLITRSSNLQSRWLNFI